MPLSDMRQDVWPLERGADEVGVEANCLVVSPFWPLLLAASSSFSFSVLSAS